VLTQFDLRSGANGENGKPGGDAAGRSHGLSRGSRQALRAGPAVGRSGHLRWRDSTPRGPDSRSADSRPGSGTRAGTENWIYRPTHAGPVVSSRLIGYGKVVPPPPASAVASGINANATPRIQEITIARKLIRLENIRTTPSRVALPEPRPARLSAPES